MNFSGSKRRNQLTRKTMKKLFELETTEEAKARQLRTEMVEITPAKACILWLKNAEICRLHDDDSESVIETPKELIQAILNEEELGIHLSELM